METPTPPPTNPQQSGRRRPLVIGFAMATALALLAAAGSALPANAATPPQTTVSFTFDDANADQLPAAAALNSRGMTGTFYINSGSVGQPSFFTRSDLTALAASGNEIGGHTVNHPDLATLPATEAKQQICLDRDNLLGWGFAVRNFAYPFASVTPAIEQLASDCGYNSARGLGDLKSRFGCDGCDYAETVPPADPYLTKALDEVDSTWTLADFESAVTNAEATGGWVQFTFHHYCDNACDPLSVSSTVFTPFLDWLKLREATNNTVVKTVDGVIGGTTKPAVNVAVTPPAPTDATGLQNPSFETSTGTTPTCWQEAGFGTNTVAYDTVTPGRTGTVAGRLRMTAYTDGDAKIMPSMDLGTCSPAAAPGTSYALSAWYKSTVQTQFEVYLRTTEGAWVYWDASPHFDAANAYTRATYITAPVPAGFTGISFGLNIAAVGTLTVDDFAIGNADQVPVTTATIAPATVDGSNGWYRTTPSVALAADLRAIPTTSQYSFDGTAWSTYSSPIVLPVGASQLSYRSVTSRKTEVARILTIKVDTDKPQLTAAYTDSSRTIAVSATDPTSGVASIEQRINGGAWTAYSGNGAAGDAARTIDYRATDVAGNVSSTSTLTIPAAPVVTPPVVTPPVVTPPVVTPPVVSAPSVLAPASVVIAKLPTARYGAKIPVSVTVSAPSGVPTGTVTALLDKKAVATGTLAGGRAAVRIPGGSAVGTHSLTINYSGDSATRSASTTARLKIVKSTATVKLSLGSKRAVAHLTYVTATIAATIKGSSQAPTGKLTLLIDGKAVKSSTLTAGKNGRADITIPHFATTGTHSIRVRLAGSPQVTTTTSAAHRLRVTAH